jgi:phosphoglycolate phosphatase
MKKILIFDFDGVLAESLPVMLEYAGRVCVELGHPRQATSEDLEALDRMEFVDFGRQLGLPEDLLQSFAARNFELFNSRGDPLPIFSGMAEAVSELSRHFKIAIVTGNSRSVVSNFLERHGLTDAVSLILGAEDPGGRAEKIRRVKDLLGDPESEAIMIGDAVSDVHAARKAGVRSIAVTWGHQSRKKLAGVKPDYLVDSPGDLLATLDGKS